MVESASNMLFRSKTNHPYTSLLQNVDNLKNSLDANEFKFSLFMEFINFINVKLVDIKDMSTGRHHKVLSQEAKFIFGDDNSQKMHEVLNKLVAYCESK